MLLFGLEHSKEGFALTDAEGRFTYMNRQHLTLFGFTDLSEVLGRPWRILYSDTEADMMVAEVMPLLMRNGSWSGHMMGRRRDGRTFSQDLTLALLPEGGIVCNCRDRTKEIEMEERTARSEKLLRSFMEHVPAAVAIKDGECRYLYVNPEFCRAIGRPPESFHGRTTSEVMPGSIAVTLEESHAQVLRNAGPVFYDLPTTDGRVYSMTTFALRDAQGAIECFCLIGRDETNRCELETELRLTLGRQGELLAMQREFVSMVSHEFRTPMAAMRGALYLLRALLKTHASPQVARYLDLQEEALVNLVDLVEQVLKLNQIEEGISELARKPVDLTALLSSVLQNFNETTASSRVVVELPPAGSDLPLVMADEGLLRSALGNLVSNGLKYSPAEKLVRMTLVAESGGWCIQVRDEGRGIPKQDKKRLFEPFFRAGNVSNIPGTGLGLRIVLRTVELHGGRVTFESSEGVGSTFSVHLPAQVK